MQDGSSGSASDGVTNNGVYGEDGDLISSHHVPGVGRVQNASSRGGGFRNGGGGGGTWSGAQSPTLSNTSSCFGGSDDGSNSMAAAQQQAALAGLRTGGFNLVLTSPGLGIPNGQHGTTRKAERDESIQHECAGHGEPERDGHIARGAAARGADRRCWRQIQPAWPRARYGGPWWIRWDAERYG